jgi:hypothetical protein
MWSLLTFPSREQVESKAGVHGDHFTSKFQFLFVSISVMRVPLVMSQHKVRLSLPPLNNNEGSNVHHDTERIPLVWPCKIWDSITPIHPHTHIHTHKSHIYTIHIRFRTLSIFSLLSLSDCLQSLRLLFFFEFIQTQHKKIWIFFLSRFVLCW